MELFTFSCFSIGGWGIYLDYCDIEWFALETTRNYSLVFDIDHLVMSMCEVISFVVEKGCLL